MSLNERFSQLVNQKQHFGYLSNIRGISKNSATTESYTELRVNVNNCNQFSQTLRLLKKLTFVVMIRMRKNWVMKWSLNSRLRFAAQSVIYRCHQSSWRTKVFCVLPDTVASLLGVLRYIRATRLRECFSNMLTIGRGGQLDLGSTFLYRAR